MTEIVVHDEPVCAGCLSPILLSVVAAPPCGHPDCPSLCWHLDCLVAYHNEPTTTALGAPTPVLGTRAGNMFRRYQ